MLKKIILTLLITTLCLATPEFDAWKVKHNKQYNSYEEHSYRLAIWMDNVAEIESFNLLGKSSYKKGVNKFADLSKSEFKSIYLSSKIPGMDQVDPAFRYKKPEGQLNQAQVDWRDGVVVSRVKDQGQCGGCWAFSTAGGMEGIGGLTDGQVYNLSPAQLVDCDHTGINDGCNGGNPYYAYPYIGDNGIMSWDDYPYSDSTKNYGKEGECAYDPNSAYYGFENDMTYSFMSCLDLESQLNKQPSSILVWAEEWSYYDGGVYDADGKRCDGEIDHAVLAVGYGYDADSMESYWIVKNSWGPDWGENGYIRILKDGDTDGEYGVDCTCYAGFVPGTWNVQYPSGSSTLTSYITFLALVLITLLN